MGVAVTEDCQGENIHTVRFLRGSKPVFYACLPRGNEARHRLVTTLWDQLAITTSSCWQRCPFAPAEAVPIQLIPGLLGKPQLLLGGYPGPAISFSESGGKVWAALCGDGADIGIDVAGVDEFQGKYPFHRVFQSAELEHAARLAGGNLAVAAALLWSIKEAAVKALGCAFHRLEPRAITVSPAAGGTVDGDGGYSFALSLSEKGRKLSPLAARQVLRVRSFPQRRRWLSLAHLQQKPTVHD